MPAAAGQARRRRWTRRLWVSLLAIALAGLVVSGAVAVETHLNRTLLPSGCGSCHRGHGVKGSTMLVAEKTRLCYSCHGSAKSGIPGESNKDVQKVFNKLSRHPVETTGQFHVLDEILPERKPDLERHVSCDDCHDVHRVSSTNPFGKVPAFTSSQVIIRRAEHEYEVCYKCHSDSANRPSDQENLRVIFSPSNPSYHPIEAPGRNGDVPSLMSGLSTGSRISCSSCHGNDDPLGAQGPHGSNFQPILRQNYVRTDGSESPYAYQLCYRCHDRGNILADKSFKSHARHVVFQSVSCATCHDPHGSLLNRHLIEFNVAVVLPDSLGRRTYFEGIGGRPRCFLKCHGVEHNEAFFTTRGW